MTTYTFPHYTWFHLVLAPPPTTHLDLPAFTLLFTWLRIQLLLDSIRYLLHPSWIVTAQPYFYHMPVYLYLTRDGIRFEPRCAAFGVLFTLSRWVAPVRSPPLLLLDLSLCFSYV